MHYTLQHTYADLQTRTVPDDGERDVADTGTLIRGEGMLAYNDGFSCERGLSCAVSASDFTTEFVRAEFARAEMGRSMRWFQEASGLLPVGHP